MKQKIFVGVGIAAFILLLAGNLFLVNTSVDSSRSQIPLYPNVKTISAEPKWPSEGEFTTTAAYDAVRTFYTSFFDAPNNGWQRYDTTEGCGASTADLTTLCYAKGKTSVGIEIKRIADGTHITTHAADE